MQRRLLDALFTAIALILFIPTALILISWNAIPGDSLYPLKTGLEDVTLLLLSGTPLVPKVSASFTQRRFNEANKLLDARGSTVGYDLLVAEASQTQALIVSKNDTITAEAFVKNIDQYKAKIDEKRTEVVAKARSEGVVVPSSTPQPVVTPIQTPVATNAPVAASPVVQQQIIINKPETIVITQESTQQVLQSLDNTEAQLEDIKQHVEQEVHDNGNGQGNENNHGNSQDHGNSGGEHQGQQNGQNH